MRKAFTLIELLIVIAIILILIAIALPNFLEAQIRAKVTRAKSEMRTIEVAMESYMTDYRTYPLPWDKGEGTYPTTGLYAEKLKVTIALTTPQAYVTDAELFDPFRSSLAVLSTNYQFGIGTRGNSPAILNKNNGRLGAIIGGLYENAYGSDCYMIVSQGPNAGSGPYNGDEVFGLTRYPSGTTGIIYAPTNGTTSMGDIFHFGPSGYIQDKLAIN